MVDAERESVRSQPSDDFKARSLDERLRKVELEVAERRHYEKVVKLLGAAAVVAGLLLGAVGFDSISDIEDNLQAVVDRTVMNHIADTEVTLEDIKEKRVEVEGMIADLNEAKMRWKSIKGAIEELGSYDANDDFAGILRDFLRDYLDEEGSERDKWITKNRGRATNLLLQVIEHIEQSTNEEDVAMQITPDDLFNVAVISRVLGRADLRRKLVDAAYEADKTAATRALYLESRAGTNAEDFEELVGMVENLEFAHPHIVVAEAWNAAENRRDYSKLIAAVDQLLKKHDQDKGTFLPSYVIAVKGEAHLRRGLPQDLEQAVVAYAGATRRLQLETPNSQWAGETLMSVLEGSEMLRRFGADMTELDRAISSSRITQLKLAYELGAITTAADVFDS